MKVEELLELPAEEREVLAHLLWESLQMEPESLHPAITDEVFAMLEKRMDAIDSGVVKTIPWEEVKTRMMKNARHES